MSERRSGPDFRRSLNDALYVVLEYHVFYPCPSVVEIFFTESLRLRGHGAKELAGIAASIGVGELSATEIIGLHWRPQPQIGGLLDHH